jgi:hypothetical protein
MERLRSLLAEGGDSLLACFSTRWLVSIADTFADHGYPIERGNAMAIVVLANVTRLAETERLYLNDAAIDRTRLEEFAMPVKPLWDGIVNYAVKHGDMPLNMWTRMRSVLTETPTLLSVFEAVLSRLLANDTLIGRLAPLNPNFCQLVEPFPHWKVVD